MNWGEIWPEILITVGATAITGVAAILWHKLSSLRNQLTASQNLARRLKIIGLSNFYESRDDYTKFREAPRLADYLAFANRKIVIAGYWLAQGAEMEGVATDLRKLLEKREALEITIVMINPDADYIPAVASQMRLTPEAVSRRALDSLRGLADLKESLAEDQRKRLDIRLHSSIPFASLIVLDPESEENGHIQFDFKLYANSRSNSIGFEIRSTTSQIATNLIHSCEQICKDAIPFNLDKPEG